MTRIFGPIFSPLFVACILALMPGTGVAQDRDGEARGEGAHIRALLGFSDTFRPARWTPLTVTVSNRGEPLSGQLEVVTRDGDEFRRALYPVVHHRRLELGRDARKRFHFTVYLETLAEPVEIRVINRGEVVARERLDLRPRFSAGKLLLVVSRDADLDYLNEAGEQGVRVLYPHPDLLPRQWQGYDAVAAVVLHGLSLESLDARQFDALSRWIARGGVLAVSGGPDYALLATPRLASLLPATPQGLLLLTDAADVGRALGAPLAATGTFHVNRVARIRGQVLHEADGVPLVLEARHGNGQVLYLTFDVARNPFDRWSAMKDVWTRLLGTTRDTAAPVHRPDDPSLVPTLLRVHAQGFPGHGTLQLFLALYLCVLATAYRLRGASSPRPRMVSIVGMAIPVLFAPAAFALFGMVLFKPGTTATLMSVVEPLPGSRFAALQVDVGLHASREGPLELEYEGAQPVFRTPLEARRRVSAQGWRVGPRDVAPADRHSYALHLLEGQDMVPFDLEASVSREARLSVRNDTGRPIHDAWLVFRGSAWFLGTVDADARMQFDLSAPADLVASDRDEWWPAMARDPRVDPRRMQVAVEALSRKIDSDPRRSYPVAGHALLMGYTTGPLRLTGASARWQRTELALVLLHFPAWLPSADPEDETNETT